MKQFFTSKFFGQNPRLKLLGFFPPLLAVTCLATSCSFNPKESSPLELLPGWSQQQIVVTLPHYPAETHPPLAGWQILCWQKSGTYSQTLPPSQKDFSLTVGKNIPTAILCYPLSTVNSTQIRFFHPAGCVYPYSQTLRWQEGFTAEIFFQLAQGKSFEELSTSPLLQFNWPRLTQQTDKRFQQAQERNSIFSPWFLQEEILKEAVLQGTASTRNIKQHTLVEYLQEEVTLGSISEENIEENFSLSNLYYRYLPLGKVTEKIILPQNSTYVHHPENAFLQDNQILTLFTKKNQKPVLARIAIERYTNQ